MVSKAEHEVLNNIEKIERSLEDINANLEYLHRETDRLTIEREEKQIKLGELKKTICEL